MIWGTAILIIRKNVHGDLLYLCSSEELSIGPPSMVFFFVIEIYEKKLCGGIMEPNVVGIICYSQVAHWLLVSASQSSKGYL